MSDVTMTNFDPQKIMQALMDIFGERYGAEITVTVERKDKTEKTEQVAQ